MMNQSMLPPNTPSEFRPFVDLLRVIADPAGAEKRLQDLAEKIVAATAATNEASSAVAALQVARGSHDDTIRRERADHEKTLAEAQANFDQAHRGREREVANRERAVAERERHVSETEKAASELKSDLEQRLARLRQIAS
jgi:predicted RNase H-like nuclease (RuvC/YqgF family)